MKITDSPHRPGTPEHDHWVRTTFIPAVARERYAEDGPKYGAESIGVKRINGRAIDLFDRLMGGVVALDDAFQALGQAADHVCNSIHSTVLIHFPDWLRTILTEEELRQICRDNHVVDAHAWSFQQLMPGPNRAQRRERGKPPVKRPRECPRHGGPADRCRPCQRS